MISKRIPKAIIYSLCLYIFFTTSLFINLIRNIFKAYEIPTLDRSETKRRYLKKHGDPRTRSRRIRKRQEELNNDGFPITGQKRKEIIKAYDLIASHRNIKGWEELVEDVSENTGIELEAVRSCLRKYFK